MLVLLPFLLFNFNSTMVRLKFIEALENFAQSSFQFHYGSIKILNLHSLLLVVFYFNSTMVRLK